MPSFTNAFYWFGGWAEVVKNVTLRRMDFFDQ